MNKNGAVQGLIVQRTVPTDTIQCPECMESVRVELNRTTHVHSLINHPCPKARTPVAFVPGKYAVVALIWNPTGDGTILAVSRKDNPEDFGLPGGKADPIEPESSVYEDPWDALCRELREETSLEIKRARYVYWRKDYSKLGDPRPMLPALCFLVDEYEGTPRQMEAGRVEWVLPYVVATSGSASFSEYNRGLFDALFIPYDAPPEEVVTPETFLRWVDECEGIEVPMGDPQMAPVALALEREGKILLGPARGPDHAWRRATRPD